MPAPTTGDLSDFLGTEVNADQAAAVLSVITSMASAYVRGQGITAGEPNDDIRAVILSAAARLVSNAAQVESESMGPFAVTYRGFDGWTIAEKYTLDRYRVKAQ